MQFVVYDVHPMVVGDRDLKIVWKKTLDLAILLMICYGLNP